MKEFEQAPPHAGRPAYRHYLLFLCCFSFFIAFIDRQIFAALMPALKAEFGLSDTALGLLAGLGFALTYSIFSVPLGYLVDRVSRKKILIACVTVWSMMTFVCGAAGSAVQLMIARLGVGAGESGVTPASVSMIADLYPPHQRGRAISLYPIAGAMGLTAAFPLGGWLVAEYGWRTAFHVVSVPGFLLALVLWFTFREPPRERSHAGSGEAPPSFGAALLTVLRHRRLMLVFAATALGSMISSINHWLPSFYQRSHGLSPLESGAMLGPALGVSTAVGMFLGGWLIDRASSRGGVPRVMAVLAPVALLQGLCGTLMLGTDSLGLSVFFTVFWALAAALFAPAGFALSQSLVEPRMRGTSLAVMNLLNNVVGYGLGPLVAGALSETLAGNEGADSLRWALVAVSISLAVITATLYGLGSRLKDDGAIAR